MNNPWERPAFLKRVDDINGYFIECFTEMPDEELEKLKDLIVDDKREEGWKLIRTRIEDYLGDIE